MDLKVVCVKQSTEELRPMRPAYVYRVDQLEDKGKIFVETDDLLVGVFRLGHKNIHSTEVYLHLDLSRTREIQKKLLNIHNPFFLKIQK